MNNDKISSDTKGESTYILYSALESANPSDLSQKSANLFLMKI